MYLTIPTSILLPTNRMSQRLGAILIGVGLILWGLYVQNNYEGFQATAAQVPPPTVTPQLMAPNTGVLTATGLDPPPESSKVPPSKRFTTSTLLELDYNSLTILQVEDLIKRILEIKTKFDLITKIKLSADIKITKLLSNSDVMNKINIIYSEVKSFIDHFFNLDINKLENDSSLKNEKDIVIQVVYTAYDQVSMLYRIYYTIPSLIVSSGTVVSTDTADNMTILNDEVIAKSVNAISMEVASIPSPSEEIIPTSTILINNATELQKNYSDTTLGVFQQSLQKFLMLVDLEISNTDLKISNIAAAGADAKKTIVLNNKILFLNSVITTLKTVYDTLLKISNISSSITSNVNTNITSYNTILANTKAKLTSKEGFQSYENSYNTPSPNIKQAYEFRLGKRQYSDDVFSGIKIFSS